MNGLIENDNQEPKLIHDDEQNLTLTQQSELNNLHSTLYHENRQQIQQIIQNKLLNLKPDTFTDAQETQDAADKKVEADANTKMNETSWIISCSLPPIFVNLALLSDDAFLSENEYLDSLEALFYIRFMIHNSEIYKQPQLYTSVLFYNSLKADTDLLQSALFILQDLYQTLYCKICRKLKANLIKYGRLPRIERLIKKYKFTPKEADAFRYITIINGGLLFPNYNGGISANASKRKFNTNLWIATQMNTAECVEFFQSERRHIKEGIIELMHGRITIPKLHKRAISSLYHCKMSADELLMLHSTALGEVLSEEGITPTQLVSSTQPSPAKSKSINNGSFLKQKGDKTVVQVLDLLKKSRAESKENADHIGIDGMDIESNRIKSDSPMKFEKITKENEQITETEKEQKDDIFSVLQPYRCNLDYLQDHFEVIGLKFRLNSGRNDYMDNDYYNDAFAQQRKQRKQSSKRELTSKLNQAMKKCELRLEASYNIQKEEKKDGGEEKGDKQGTIWLPRVEILKRELGLDEFEKWVLLTLVGKVLSAEIRKQMRYNARLITVEVLLSLHCADLKEQIAKRKYFYKGATLLKEGIITMNEGGIDTNIMTTVLDIDRRMVDYCVELDTEFESLVEGSILFTPTVTLDRVVLPQQTKEKIIRRVENLDELQKAQSKYGLQQEHGYGDGLCLLFHGMSGTGKTLMANAIANHLGKKILLANFPTLRIAHASHKTDNGVRDTFRYVFREAKIQNAIVFFDECESLFQTRQVKSAMSEVNTALSCIEQYDDLVIMATNRPYDLDEAMYRRIHMVVEFRAPDIHLRKEIWQKHMPHSLPLTQDVDVAELAMKFELTGGFIKNAVQSAIQSALLRDKDNIEISHDDLLRACEEQIIGQLQLQGFGNDERVLPTIKLSSLCLQDSMRKQCNEIINLLKAKKVLSGSWGFKEIGTRILLIGKAGCGKSSVAEAIAFECGKPMKVLSCATMLVSSGSSMTRMHATNHYLSWSKIFSETNTGALFVVRNCELLFNQMVNLATLGYIIHQLKRAKSTFFFIFDGELKFGDIQHLNALQKGLLHLFQFVIRFEKPAHKMRILLWKKLIPKQTPNDLEEKDFTQLAQTYNDFVQSDIISSIHMAAAKACLRNQDLCFLTIKDLMNAANQIQQKRLTQDFNGIMYT